MFWNFLLRQWMHLQVIASSVMFTMLFQIFHYEKFQTYSKEGFYSVYLYTHHLDSTIYILLYLLYHICTHLYPSSIHLFFSWCISKASMYFPLKKSACISLTGFNMFSGYIYIKCTVLKHVGAELCLLHIAV